MMKFKNIQAEHYQAIVNCANDGMSQRQIQIKMGIPETTMKRYIKYHNIAIVSRVDSRISTILDLYKLGKSINQISEDINVSKCRIRRVLTKNELKTQGQIEHHKNIESASGSSASKHIQYNSDKRLLLRYSMLNYKNNICKNCGYDNCRQALDFHHRNPDEKEFNINDIVRKNKEIIKTEIDKCDLLCQNCHKQVHHNMTATIMQNLQMKRKERQVEYKGCKCDKCLRSYPSYNYDFHHMNPTEKEFDWRMLRNMQESKINQELDKCILLCTNCHRETHYDDTKLKAALERNEKRLADTGKSLIVDFHKI